MKNQEVWASYDFYTGEVTKHSRYLGFAGIAICWFFRTTEITFPNLILTSLILLVVFFVLDLAQYYVSAMRIRKWMQKEEAEKEKKTGSIDGEYWPVKSLDVPSFWLFKIKLLFLLLGFLCIGLELSLRI
ncbi:MAG: hypothetical protein PF495_10635 [Spirochaetales bacterium]|jgi:hypothetical protein|nr:hypothetical protein [Spirochaetales bacterium]